MEGGKRKKKIHTHTDMREERISLSQSDMREERIKVHANMYKIEIKVVSSQLLNNACNTTTLYSAVLHDGRRDSLI